MKKEQWAAAITIVSLLLLYTMKFSDKREENCNFSHLKEMGVEIKQLNSGDYTLVKIGTKEVVTQNVLNFAAMNTQEVSSADSCYLKALVKDLWLKKIKE